MGLMLCVNALFQLLELFSPFPGFDGKITVESKTLPIESRSHYG